MAKLEQVICQLLEHRSSSAEPPVQLEKIGLHVSDSAAASIKNKIWEGSSDKKSGLLP